MMSGYVYAPGNNTVGFTWDNIMLSGYMCVPGYHTV